MFVVKFNVLAFPEIANAPNSKKIATTGCLRKAFVRPLSFSGSTGASRLSNLF